MPEEKKEPAPAFLQPEILAAAEKTSTEKEPPVIPEDHLLSEAIAQGKTEAPENLFRDARGVFVVMPPAELSFHEVMKMRILAQIETKKAADVRARDNAFSRLAAKQAFEASLAAAAQEKFDAQLILNAPLEAVQEAEAAALEAESKK